MYKQYEYLREAVTMTRNETYRLDLPKTGQLSGLLLKISANLTSGAVAAAAAWRLQDYLTKVEIIKNGATVIKSYNFTDLLFLSWLRQGIVPPHFWRTYGANTQFEYGLLLFGRSLGDPDYGLTLNERDSYELRITNTATSTYWSTDLTISILQVFVRDAPGGFRGYIRSEEWRNYTTAQNGTEYFLLPTEYPICTLALQAIPSNTAGMFDTNPQNLAYDIDLSKKGGTLQMYKGGMDDLLVVNYMERGAEVITNGQAYVDADRGLNVAIARMFGWVAGASSKNGAVASTFPTMSADDTDGTISFEDYTAERPIQFWTRGMGYQDFAWLLANLDLDPAKNIDPANDGELRLNIQARDASTAASGTVRLLLERVVAG